MDKTLLDLGLTVIGACVTGIISGVNMESPYKTVNILEDNTCVEVEDVTKKSLSGIGIVLSMLVLIMKDLNQLNKKREGFKKIVRELCMEEEDALQGGHTCNTVIGKCGKS